MKRTIIIFLFVLGLVATGAQARPSAFLIAQNEQPAAEPLPAASAPAAEAAASEPRSGQATSVKEETRAAASGKQSHKEFAKLDLKECAGCHTGSGIAPNHGAAWSREHWVFAAQPQKNCADCHDQQYCLDCHTGGGIDADLSVGTAGLNYVPHSHRTDFRELHPLKALDNPQTCTRCHDSRFCSDCHAKFRGPELMVQSHRRAWSDLPAATPGPLHSTFDPTLCQTCHPGGVLPKHVWSQEHAREARRNLQSCQTCHSDGAVCQTCHSARRGLQINPHPRNWSAVKDKYRSRSSGRSCIVCHDTY